MVRKPSEGGLHWLKHNASQKSHWTMNRHLNNEGQEWETGHTKRRVLMRKGGSKKEVKKVNMVDVLSI
jgi:hypothetical protein